MKDKRNSLNDGCRTTGKNNYPVGKRNGFRKIMCYKKRGFLLISDDLSDIIANL